MKKSRNTSFNGTDWLTLELAIEVIGDMIGFYSQQLHVAIENNDNSEAIAKLEMEIANLGKERQRCYDMNSNHEVIFKAFTVYSSHLRNISSNSTSS